MAFLTRRLLLALAGAVVFALPAAAQDRVGARDISLGNPNAPVQVVEYASITCPHCARFNANVFPTFKAKYVNTGKVLYTYREFPTPPENISAAGAMIARCAGPDRYLAVIDALFRNQEQALYTKHDVHAFFMAGAQAGGLSEEQMKACIADPASLQAFNDRTQHAHTVDKIDGTPTVLVNGKVVEPAGPEMTVADLDAAIQPLLPATLPRARHPVRRRVAH